MKMRDYTPQFMEWSGGEPMIDMPQDAYNFWVQNIVPRFGLDPETEHLLAVYLDEDRRVIGSLLIAGYSGFVAVGLAELIPAPEPLKAKTLVLLHSHPVDYDVSPSAADFSFTDALRLRARTWGIELADHLIVGFRRFGDTVITAGGFYSFKANHHLYELAAPKAT